MLKKYAKMACSGLFPSSPFASFQFGCRRWVVALPIQAVGVKLALA